MVGCFISIVESCQSVTSLTLAYRFAANLLTPPYFGNHILRSSHALNEKLVLFYGFKKRKFYDISFIQLNSLYNLFAGKKFDMFYYWSHTYLVNPNIYLILLYLKTFLIQDAAIFISLDSSQRTLIKL